MKRVTNSWLITLVLLTMSASAYSQTFNYNGYEYSVNADGKTVTLSASSDEETGTVIIPDYVYDENDKCYPVTAVESGAFRKFSGSKIVIGDNVTTIGEKAFQQAGKQGSECVLIMGKSLASLPKLDFQHFGQHESTKILIKCEDKTSMSHQSFSHMKDPATIYFRDKEMAEPWKNFVADNTSTWPYPYEREIQGGRWGTVVFPMDISKKEVISYFGKGTEVAYLESAKYDSEKKEYQLHFAIAEEIKANKPYLLKIRNVSSDFVCEVEGDPSASTLKVTVPIYNKPAGCQAQMIGVYSQHTLAKNEFYLRNKEGDLFFYLATGKDGSFVGANKCYFKILDQNGNLVPAKFSCHFDNSGETTAIPMETSRQNESIHKDIFNIYGQYVGDDAENLPKGIYIVNGKKIIVK
ncbi:MAG: hypothetical protein MSS96_04460 [Bacteroidales bacterium]|nr:hypothetical protein [Bacteroidales bacterium]